MVLPINTEYHMRTVPKNSAFYKYSIVSNFGNYNDLDLMHRDVFRFVEEYRQRTEKMLNDLFATDSILVTISKYKLGSIEIILTIAVAYDVISKYKDFKEGLDLAITDTAIIFHETFGKFNPISLKYNSINSPAINSISTSNVALSAPPTTASTILKKTNMLALLSLTISLLTLSSILYERYESKQTKATYTQDSKINRDDIKLIIEILDAIKKKD